MTKVGVFAEILFAASTALQVSARLWAPALFKSDLQIDLSLHSIENFIVKTSTWLLAAVTGLGLWLGVLCDRSWAEEKQSNSKLRPAAEKVPVGQASSVSDQEKTKEIPLKKKEDVSVSADINEPYLPKKERFRPLFFDLKENGVELSEQVIEYDASDAKLLKIGPYSLEASEVYMHLSREPGQSLDEGIFSDEWKQQKAYVLTFHWPLSYLSEGRLEILTDQGQVLWKKEVSVQESVAWQAYMDQLTRKKYSTEAIQKRLMEAGQEGVEIYESDLSDRVQDLENSFQPSRMSRRHKGAQFGVVGEDVVQVPLWRVRKPFRYCLTKDSRLGRLALCSKRYQVQRTRRGFVLRDVSRAVNPRVFVNDKPVTLKGSAIFLDHRTPIKFAALLGNGTYFEFISIPKPVNIVDMALDQDSGQVQVIGYGNPPMGSFSWLDLQREPLLSWLNFFPTIGELRSFWVTEFPLNRPHLYLKGFGGVPFKQEFYFSKLPKRELRPFLPFDAPGSTYADHIKVTGRIASDVEVSADDASVKKLADKNQFEWEFPTPKEGEFNRSSLLLGDKAESWKAFYEVYRAFPTEVALRTTGVVSNQFELVLLGEVAAQTWFEDILGLESYWLSQQRWGVAARYFQALAGIGGKTQKQSLIKLAVANVDVKYRLSPGVWGRDPSVGVSLNAQTVALDRFNSNMLGAGVFWARSMPSFFDKMFNLLPFMRYPKWVDMEFLFYMFSPDGKSQLENNFAMNFHGKVQWSQQFYGEAGFGMKFFSFADLVERKKVGMGMAYGTVGLGYNF